MVLTITCSLHFIEIVKLSDNDDSDTLVSNDVENEWRRLFLRIGKKNGEIKVTVEKKYNVSQVAIFHTVYCN